MTQNDSLQRPSALLERINRKDPKKLLALDGGGIRGVLSLQILKRIEDVLRSQRGGDPAFRLADYFDYIAGTSTGAIIAAGLSRGMAVQEVIDFYLENGARMFTRANFFQRLRYAYSSEALAEQLQTVFGAKTTLGSNDLHTLLLVIMRNATTDSPWPISNNPYAKYNARSHPSCNLDFPLWQLVRASTAAPTYFPPEVITVRGHPFVFVDGGVTMYNNPAFQMFLMATVDRYWIHAPLEHRGWDTGVDKMLVVSVGTGTSAGANYSLKPSEMHLLFNAKGIPSALMYAALNEQDFLCRVFGDCLSGAPLDREVNDLVASFGPFAPKHKLFRYLRYNAELTADGLRTLGCADVDPEAVQQLDSIDATTDLIRVGQAAAQRDVKSEHFAEASCVKA
ncbi:patatin [Methylocystis sp. MitZ-2018]|nr:patatin [Methylocystis sp. MitZ-2018]